MSDTNYQSQWWGLIYDQIMADGLEDWVEANRRFYQAQLNGVTGPVLECACGTGIFLLPLLEAGYDMYGLDISAAMLATLKKKAAALGITGIDARLSLQNMEDFAYTQRFAAVIIPTNSFANLATQEAQIAALRRIHNHLVPGGRLLLDLRHPGLRSLVEDPDVVEGSWYTWTHPETGLPIRQRLVGRTDFDNQLVIDQCFIEYEGQQEDFRMSGRWVNKEEFQLLLRLAGFSSWQSFGDPDGGPLVLGKESISSYWVANRS